jgi:hypothetical protein
VLKTKGESTVKTIAIIAMLFCFGCEPATPTNTPLIPNTATPALTKAKEAPKSQKKHEVYKVGMWTGQGIKNTETFHIPSDSWSVIWSTSPINSYGGILQIFIYRSDGTLVGLSANVMGKDSNNSYMRGAGDYYLKINSANHIYSIIVTALREVQQ